MDRLDQFTHDFRTGVLPALASRIQVIGDINEITPKLQYLSTLQGGYQLTRLEMIE